MWFLLSAWEGDADKFIGFRPLVVNAMSATTGGYKTLNSYIEAVSPERPGLSTLYRRPIPMNTFISTTMTTRAHGACIACK